jgi:DNA (cytosine-5)-methyltransferase 1
MLERHFEMKLSSRLPVIAIYSVYQQLFKEVKRYGGKKLGLLNVHTSSDKHGYGDIEIWNADGTPFEMVEIKHKIPIDRNLIFDIVKKSEGTTIERYYILTTAKENFISTEEEEYINKFILKIKKDSGLEIIANGIYYSLKYYLRFINDYKNFIRSYTENLITDAKNSTEIKEFHITEWQNILKEHHLY